MGLEWSFQPSVELRRRPVKDFSDSFWKGNSRNFACTGFSEVQGSIYSIYV
jgi:hypothetical protein